MSIDTTTDEDPLPITSNVPSESPLYLLGLKTLDVYHFHSKRFLFLVSEAT